MRVFLIALTMLFYAGPAAAQASAPSLHMELAADHVDITTGFNGTSVVVFGTTGGPGDVIVKLKGPERTVIVRRKGRTLGTWVNLANIEFRRVPSYYDYTASLGKAALAGYPALMREEEIGVDNLGFYPEDEDEKAETIAVFRDSLIRKMQGRGLFPVGPKVLTFLDPGFFKASFDLPPGVPMGIYTVEALLVTEGKVVARQSKTLQVGQVGFNARVYLFANNHSFFYGVFAIMMALISGWSAFTFLRRD
jgi:uncharacterized protein (TIGR02186 family)